MSTPPTPSRGGCRSGAAASQSVSGRERRRRRGRCGRRGGAGTLLAAGPVGTSTPREETGRSARRSMHGVVGNVQVAASALYAFDGGGAEVARSTTHRYPRHGRMASTLYLERERESTTLLFDYFSITACAYMCVRCSYQRYIIPHSPRMQKPKG